MVILTIPKLIYDKLGVGVAVTGTFYQVTQPVSGAFYPATQPISLAPRNYSPFAEVTTTFTHVQAGFLQNTTDEDASTRWYFSSLGNGTWYITYDLQEVKSTVSTNWAVLARKDGSANTQFVTQYSINGVDWIDVDDHTATETDDYESNSWPATDYRYFRIKIVRTGGGSLPFSVYAVNILI